MRSRPASLEQRRLERVKRLLDGELLDAPDPAYDLDAHHLGVIATGPGAEEAIRAFVASLERRLLLTHADEGAVWAWFGGRRPLEPAAVEPLLAAPPTEAVIAFGEPARGLDGWRLSHRQALAALSIAQRGPDSVVCYRDVALLAMALHDQVLARSLEDLYLIPLSKDRDGGEACRRTLRAYFAARRNVTSTASALGITRKTVNARLRAVETRLGRPLDTCAPDLELALRLQLIGPATRRVDSDR